MKKSIIFESFVLFLVMLFLLSITMSVSLVGVNLTESVIKWRAIFNLVNTIILGLIVSVLNILRYKIFTERKVKKIIDASERIAKGDFSIRINEDSVFSDDDLLLITKKINLLAEELSKIETIQNDFIASVSHELKTPLAVISNYASILANSEISETERDECIQQINSTCQQFSEMVSNILKLNKLENQSHVSDEKDFNLSEQLVQCILNFEAKIDEKNINIATEIPDDVKFKGDAELLSIMWNNLISNAVKFTPNEGMIFIALEETEYKIIVTVNDSGCGINPKIGPHIFDKFVQGDTSHKSEGNGLGLAMVKKIADITGSEINVDSEIDCGTKFEILLRK